MKNRSGFLGTGLLFVLTGWVEKNKKVKEDLRGCFCCLQCWFRGLDADDARPRHRYCGHRCRRRYGPGVALGLVPALAFVLHP